MEGLAPPLLLALDVRNGLMSGKSLRESLLMHCQESHTKFAKEVMRWVLSGKSASECQFTNFNPYRRNLILLLEMGIGGCPVAKELEFAIEQIRNSCFEQLEEELRVLPFKALIPLFLFTFPAVLIVLLVPMASFFVEGLF